MLEQDANIAKNNLVFENEKLKQVIQIYFTITFKFNWHFIFNFKYSISDYLFLFQENDREADKISELNKNISNSTNKLELLGYCIT